MTNTAQLLNRWHIQTPMITQPESTILGTSSTVEKPVARDGEIVIRPMMPVSLSFDHRVMDGAQPTQFLSKFAGLIEDPDTIWAYLR
jgi:pyruvate/2-oxoglutarate dehydrogenase complex dihydrolipoamide acyltransferase (E2) component